MKYLPMVPGFLIALLGATTASAQTPGEWYVGAAQGYQEHIVRNGPGNTFNISCDIGAAIAGEMKRTSVFIDIIGKPPPPNSLADIFVIDEVFRMPVDKQGTIQTDCNVCAGSFAALWNKLRKSSVIVVQFPDGRSSKFVTVGAGKALAPKPFATGISR